MDSLKRYDVDWSSVADDNIETLNTDGIVTIPQILPKNLLDDLKTEFNRNILMPQILKANDRKFAMINQPLATCVHTTALTFHPLVTELADRFFDWTIDGPGVGTVNLRRSHVYPNQRENDTTMYHCDQNRPDGRLLKFFVYLNDVDMDGGPFTFMKGSHKEKPKSWNNPYRWADEPIESFYGPNRIVHATGQYGDLIACCTNGFHKGLCVKKTTRDMYTINYVDEAEPERFKISKQNYDSLDENQRHHAKFLDII